MLERLRLIGLETGSECQTDTGRVTLGLDKTRTNLPEYWAELKCLNSEHRERKNLTRGICIKAGLWCHCCLIRRTHWTRKGCLVEGAPLKKSYYKSGAREHSFWVLLSCFRQYLNEHWCGGGWTKADICGNQWKHRHVAEQMCCEE